MMQIKDLLDVETLENLRSRRDTKRKQEIEMREFRRRGQEITREKQVRAEHAKQIMRSGVRRLA